MPPSPTIVARNQRILAGYLAGRCLLDLAFAEQLDPALVRRVLRAAGITPGPLRPRSPDPCAGRLADHTWLRAEYATKGACQIAEELGCGEERVYKALHAAGVTMHKNASYRPMPDPISPETADRMVSLYLDGMSAGRIATELGLSTYHVIRMVKARGVKRSKSEAVALGRRSKPASRSAKKPAQPVGQWAPELQQEVLARYAAGESGVTIAAALGLGPCSVYKLLKERGVTRAIAETRRMGQPKPPSSEPKPKLKPKAVARSNEAVVLPPDVTEQVLARYAEGEPPGAIAAVLGVALGRVYRCLKERGAWRDRSEAAKVRHARAKARRELEGPPVEAPKSEPRPLLAELAEKVVERYVAGDTGEAIAADLHIGHGRVFRLLRERGVIRTPAATLRLRVEAGVVRVDARNRGQRLPADVVVEVLERYVAGEGGTTIARALGLKREQVYDLLNGHGVIRNRRKTARPSSD